MFTQRKTLETIRVQARIVRTAAFVFVLGVALSSNAQRLGSLEGTWRGKIKVVSATATTPAAFWHAGDSPELSVAIHDDIATVRVNQNGWRELGGRDGFHVSRVESSALVYSVQVANGWVENWMLTVTKKDTDTTLVFLSYVAGGTLDRIEKVSTEFAVGAMGELARTTDPAE